jgi:transglutaminase-like putative cysteine protease
MRCNRIIFSISIAIIWPAILARAQDRGYDVVVSDSKVPVTLSAPLGSRWLMVQIKKQNSKPHLQISPWNPQKAPSNIYLIEGPGSYTIDFFWSQSTNFSENSYAHQRFLTVENLDSRDLGFITPSLEIQSDSPEIVQQAKLLTHGLTTDFEKAIAIHDWITEQIEYDIQGVLQKTYLQTPADAQSTFETKLAVCSGFANLTAALQRAAGLRTKVVTGKLIGSLDEGHSDAEICKSSDPSHAWNEVFVDGRWVIEDTTLDAGSEDGFTGLFKRTPDHKEFFDPAPMYFSLTHVKCEENLQ